MGRRVNFIEKQITERLGEIQLNKQGCLMKIVEYNSAIDIVVEFQDERRARVHSTYQHFKNRGVKNPYYPSIYGIGIVGEKYLSYINNKQTKEYLAWKNILSRCYDSKVKEKLPTYKNAICCKEWLYYPNFHEWLYSQENFNKWKNGSKWAVDKDILHKGNKVYSPENCCLVPENVNNMFVKRDNDRGDLPIGVCKVEDYFVVQCHNPFTNKQEFLGCRNNIDDAFHLYKTHKENLIKQIAKIEYSKDTITKECYEAMLKYEVALDD